MTDLTAHVAATRADLLRRYAEVQGDLADMYKEQAFLKASQVRVRVDTFNASVITTIAGREREADLMALEHTCGLYDVEGKICALLAEQRLLDRLILAAMI